MSCWVVPSVAAELWGISIEQVLRKIQAGDVIHKRESGWTFVDVDPNGPVFEPVRSNANERPATFAAIDEDGEMELENSSFQHWERARGRTTRLRLAPPRFAA